MAEIKAQNVTIRGRLSFPHFTMPEAIENNKRSKYPKVDSEVRPSFQLLLEEAQQEKLLKHLKDVFIPWCIEQGKAGEKSGLSAAEAKKLTKVIDEADWEVDPLFGLLKPVHEKTAPLAPEAVSTITVKGFKGQDLEQKVKVTDENQLRVPDPDLIIPERGLLMPARDTTLELYPGSRVGATINLFAFVGAQPGITANTSTAVFLSDDERFGGGGDITDEDEMFVED